MRAEVRVGPAAKKGRSAAKAKSPERKLAERIAKKIAGVENVVAVTLGGSRARGTADRHSDLDLGVYYRAEQKPNIAALRELAAALDDRGAPEAATDFGDWGPWINGGAWLVVDGRRVDWLYRELGHVVQTITDCRAGRISCAYQAGHPHGFHSHTYMGEVALGEVLADPRGILVAMKQLAASYPPGLKRALTDRYLWEAGFALETTAKAAKRGDVPHVAGSLYRCVASLVQVLYAINERWFLNEKGSLDEIAAFERRPREFVEAAEVLTGKPGTTAAQLQASHARAEKLVASVRQLAAGA